VKRRHAEKRAVFEPVPKFRAVLCFSVEQLRKTCTSRKNKQQNILSVLFMPPENQFPAGWIGRGEPTEWHLCDLFLWRWAKEQVCPIKTRST